ncbi:hypothetical protein [Brucella pituitosa]|uniref:Uncharacterized protein n=1 Tax=Brucella pituitosa TaxID=571256 RepID=A0A643F5L3_9HYPH|nr:hypothetical protein [Brucella pituitosa]KAB0573420.1 hypothetical protein F7Q93_02700 [Brucella pituitosa]
MTLIDRLSNLDGPDREITEREGYIRELSKGTQYGFENDAKAISHHMGRIAILRAKEASNAE